MNFCSEFRLQKLDTGYWILATDTGVNDCFSNYSSNELKNDDYKLIYSCQQLITISREVIGNE